MKFFAKIMSLFRKNIAILPYQKSDMVSFVKLKKHCVKIGSYAEVEENFNLVFVYYNKVCDVLSSGTHKMNEDTIPKLYRFSKTPVGLKALMTREIVSDAYFINLKEFKDNRFKTIERVSAVSDRSKLKIKLDGTFSMKVTDTLKFMKALCNDYAVIRNKKTMKEICSTVGFEVSKALNSKNFSVDDYIFNKEKVIATMEELVNKHTSSFGIQVSNFEISNILVNKKRLNEVQLNALENNKTKSIEFDLNKMAEANTVTPQENESVIYVGAPQNASAQEGNATFGAQSNINAQENVSVQSNLNANAQTNQNSQNGFNNNQSGAISQNQTEINKILEESANIILSNVNNKKVNKAREREEQELKKQEIRNAEIKKQEEYNKASIKQNDASSVSLDTKLAPPPLERNVVYNGGFEKPKTHASQPAPMIVGDAPKEDSYKEPAVIGEYNNNSKTTASAHTSSSQQTVVNKNTSQITPNKITVQKATNKTSEQNLISNKPSSVNNTSKQSAHNGGQGVNSANQTKQTQKQTPKAKCQNCGAEITEDGAKFCEKCGSAVSNYKVCACCGAKNFRNEKVCCVCQSVLD